MASSDYDGRQVPVILFPRYTTILGTGGDEFTTLPLDMTEFESARITLWRSTMQGTSSPTVTFFFDESTDRNTWTNCELTPFGGETIPSDNSELVVPFPVGRKWFRLRARLDGGAPAVTIWAQGFLIRRQR